MRTVTDLPCEVTEDEHVPVPLPDGTTLAARIWRPADSEQHPVPAVLEFIPYRKRDFTAARDAVHHPYMAGHGYACLRVDLRGSGESEGVLTHEYLEQELRDAGLRVEGDYRAEKMGYKIREAQLEKIPYMLVVGAQEMENGTVSVRARKEEKGGTKTVEEFKAQVLAEVASRER